MNLQEILLRITSIGGKALAEATKTDPTDSLGYQRTHEQTTNEQRYEHWQEGIDLLDQFLILNREAGEDFATQYIGNHDNIDEDYQFKALLRLHARACQTTHEIITLIKTGFADGAYARWRNLYETAATALFIKQEEGAGERFLDYRYIADYHRAQTHQDYATAGKLDIQPFTEEEIEIIGHNRDKMVNKYTSDFDDRGRGYGWASKYFSNPSFLAIAEETDIEHLKPYYILTHKLIHSGSTSATYSMGRMQTHINYHEEEVDDFMEIYREMAYPSNYGFADAAQLTAISLTQVTTALLNLQPTPMRLVTLQALQSMIDDISKAFIETQLAMKKEEGGKW